MTVSETSEGSTRSNLSEIAGRLTDPPASVKDENQQTITRISLAFQLLLFVVFVIRDVMKFTGMVAVDTLTGVSLAFLFSYLLGRLYHPRVSTILSLFLLNIMSYSLIFGAESMTRQDVFGSLVWLSWSMVLASYLLEIRWTTTFIILNLGAVLLLPLFSPISDMSMISSSFAFLSGISSISLLGSWLLKRAGVALSDAQQEVIQNERLAVLGKMSGGIGHELRNPLAAMKNSIYYLKMVMNDTDDSEVQDTLDILDNEIVTSEMIIASLLDFASPKSPNKKKLELNELIQNALARVQVPDGVELVKQFQTDLPFLLADSIQLSRVMVNLSRNAVQAMPEGGEITIRAEVVKPGWVSISVSDTGIGISPEIMKRLFEPLFTTKAKGVGLGLAITKTFVEAHGGSVSVESQLDEGSTFTVELPILAHETQKGNMQSISVVGGV